MPSTKSIVATDLNNTAVDIQQLLPMVEATQQTLAAMPGQWSADDGYCSKANLAYTTQLEIDYDTEFFYLHPPDETRPADPEITAGPSPQGRD